MDVMYKERIGPVDDHHKYLGENEYIINGYRLYFNSFKKILKSLFMLHNETTNIWTHLIGSSLFVIFFFYFTFTTDYSTKSLYLKDYINTLHEEFQHKALEINSNLQSLFNDLHTFIVSETLEQKFSTVFDSISTSLKEFDSKYEIPVQFIKRWPILIYLISAISCLTMSSCFHLFNAHSKKVKKIMNSLDYAGIAILICGSFFPPIYYIFYCHDDLIIFYLTSISVSSLLVFLVTLNPNFQKAHCRWFRGVIFLILGLFGVVPVAHIAFL